MTRGYHLMKGYFGDDEETAATIDADGWLHTGDIGIMDERGYIRITDRLKDMYIVGGFNAYPAEIEELLLEQREDRAGRGGRRSPTSAWARSAWPSWCPGPGSRIDADEVVAWARAHMANYKVPRPRRGLRRAAGERQRQGGQVRAARERGMQPGQPRVRDRSRPGYAPI